MTDAPPPHNLMPWEPEPMNALRARFPAAILRRWDFRQLELGAAPAALGADRPDVHRAHVFDLELCAARLRLVISRELVTATNHQEHDWVHVWFTFLPAAEEVYRMPLRHLVEVGETYVARIALGRLGGGGEPYHIHSTRGEVPHLFYLPPAGATR